VRRGPGDGLPRRLHQRGGALSRPAMPAAAACCCWWWWWCCCCCLLLSAAAAAAAAAAATDSCCCCQLAAGCLPSVAACFSTHPSNALVTQTSRPPGRSPNPLNPTHHITSRASSCSPQPASASLPLRPAPPSPPPPARSTLRCWRCLSATALRCGAPCGTRPSRDLCCCSTGGGVGGVGAAVAVVLLGRGWEGWRASLASVRSAVYKQIHPPTNPKLSHAPTPSHPTSPHPSTATPMACQTPAAQPPWRPSCGCRGTPCWSRRGRTRPTCRMWWRIRSSTSRASGAAWVDGLSGLGWVGWMGWMGWVDVLGGWVGVEGRHLSV